MISEKELLGLIQNALAEKDTGAGKSCTPNDFHDMGPAREGVAWVRDGKIFVRDPEGGNPPATVAPSSGVDLYVNGVKQAEQAPVFSSDIIEVRLERKEFAGKYKLVVREDKMEAYLFVEPARIKSYRLVDQEPQHHLVLEAAVDEALKSPVDFDLVKKLLAEANVIKGINYPEIFKLIKNPERRKVVVARGTPPEPPVDEKLEILFPRGIDYTPVVKEDGTLDYHNIKNLISVEAGTPLAVKRPGIPGKPGVNVTGGEVQPPAPRKVALYLGKGAVIHEDNCKVLAGKTGRPTVKQSGSVYFIDVEDVLVHNGDVDIRSGNLRFKGSLLVVRGNVHESMTVQATGLVIIDGIVTGARVIANDSIRINGNSVNSMVSSGISREVLDNLLRYIQAITKGFQQIFDVVKILASQEKVKNANINYGYLVKIVIEKKITEIPENTSKLNMILKSFFVDLPDEVEKVIVTLNRALADPHQLATDEDFFELFKDLELISGFFNSKRAYKADLDMAGAVNCRITSTGNVTIRKNGCFNTAIQAGGSVKISSVFRGGRIQAGDSVLINDAGTETAVKTAIEVADKSVVRIGTCNEGVVIKVGRRVGRVMSRARDLVAKLDGGGNLEITFFRN